MIGHMLLLHGCTLEDRAVAGTGTIIFSCATIESDGMLTSSKVIKSGKLWTARPAKYLRDQTADEIASNQAVTAFYVENYRSHAAVRNAS